MSEFPHTDMIDYPHPLHRDGEVLMAHLILPRDLRQTEVKRLIAMLQSLVVYA